MTGYLIRRLLQSIITLFVLTILVFLLLRLAPGDPARASLPPGAPEEQVAEMRKLMKLDGPLYSQYGEWLVNTMQGDLGISLQNKQEVADLIIQRVPRTVQLAGTTMLVSIVVGLGLGILAALKPGSIVDYVTRIVSLAGFAMPSFWLGIMLILFFAVLWRIFPTSGYDSRYSIVLPTITLSAQLVGVLASMVNAVTAEVLREDYIVTARAKGLSGRYVVFHHVLKNTFITVITLLGLQLGGLLGGAVIVETVFGWPGVGLLMVDAVGGRDYPLVQALALLAGISFLGINLAVDLLYAVVDPRVRNG